MSDFGQTLGRETPPAAAPRTCAHPGFGAGRSSCAKPPRARPRQEPSLAARTNLRRWLFTTLHNQRVSEVCHMVREQRALADERVAALRPASLDPSTRIALLELDRAIAVLPEARRQVVADRPRRNVLRRGRRHPRGPGRDSPIPARTRAPYRSADREARLAVRRCAV
jgi:hypothetical protein